MESLSAFVFYFNGSICSLIFLIGTLGNIFSFLYFKSKKRDISSVIYMLITANDIVVSITVLPVAISYLSRGRPGIIFGEKFGCGVWQYVWHTAICLSVFLVLCLCTARTVSLIRPFQGQKIGHLAIAVVAYLAINTAITATLNSFDGVRIMFDSSRFRCESYFNVTYLDRKAEYKAFFVAYCIFYTAPAIAVTISCVLSALALKNGNMNVQQADLRQSRNRATVTILLFALLYAVCNLPLVVDHVVFTYGVSREKWDILSEFYRFDEKMHFQNAITTLLPAANSAANPILYFWRMPALREYIVARIRTIMGLQVSRGSNLNSVRIAGVHRCDTVVEIIRNNAPVVETIRIIVPEKPDCSEGETRLESAECTDFHDLIGTASC